MKCDSDGCDRPAVARWATVAYPMTTVQVTFLLCQGHDEWYQDSEAEINRAFRIGLLRDEVCLHTSGQREAARLLPQPVPALTPPCHGTRCQALAGHCTGCGGETHGDTDKGGRCPHCRDNVERPHSWCPA